MTKGRLFVISAPSGAGKTTVLRKVMAEIPGIGFSVSHTTRAPRPGEQNGTDYHFVDHAEFEKMISENCFLEYARVHTNLYGTSMRAVNDLLADGQDVILDIDVQGAAILREQKNVNAAFVFIAPPSMDELARRLTGRGTESQDTIDVRLQNATVEMQQASKYDYLIVNDDLNEAIRVMSSIVVAERAKGHRRPSGAPIEISGIKVK